MPFSPPPDEVILQFLREQLQIRSRDAPAYWQEGSFVKRISDKASTCVYNPTFAGDVDSDSSKHLVMFNDGRAWDSRAGVPVLGTPEMRCSRHCSYPMPLKEMAAIETYLNESGVDLIELWQQCRVAEKSPLLYNDKYPGDVEAKLKIIYDCPGMDVFRLLVNSFFPRGLQGRDFEGPNQPDWATALMRGPKSDAAAIAQLGLEHFWVDVGTHGCNGKSFNAVKSREIFGSYVSYVKKQFLQGEMPNASSADVSLLGLRGVRELFTPEIDTDRPLKTAVLRDLADPSTLWTARSLHNNSEVTFKIPALLSFSSNVSVDLGNTNGGNVRRALAAEWPVTFKPNPDSADRFQREAAQEDIKSPQFYTPERRAGYLVLVFSLAKAYGKELLLHKPKAILDATEALLASSLKDYIKEQLSEIDTARAAEETYTRHKLVNDMMKKAKEMNFRTNEKSMENVVKQFIRFDTRQGVREAAYHIEECRFLLNPSKK
jgi:hypothetical protein